MSLYDGLDMGDKVEGKKDAKPDVSGWGSSMKLLETQKQIQAKKASLLYMRKKQGLAVTPVFDLKKRNDDVQLHFNMKTGKLEKKDLPGPAQPVVPVTQPQAPVPAAAPFIGSEAPVTASFALVKDEYDPYRPNDYEEVVKRRREQKQKEREEDRKKQLEEREKRRKERHKENVFSDEDSEDEEASLRKKLRNDDDEEEEAEEDEDNRRERDREQDRPRTGGAAIAPPPSLIEEFRPPDDEQSPLFPRDAKSNTQKIAAGLGLAGSVVSKMMAKMGYREGQGLGKSEQGMSTALQVEKTSKRGGKIIHEKDIAKANESEGARIDVSNANLLRNPSKVILLRNMVGPGEVDEELEPETAEECQKYGKVIKCIIFEIPGAHHEECVRIFVEFERQESAIKAIVDLNGRFFGGRTVKAGFYSQDRFKRLELAEPMD